MGGTWQRLCLPVPNVVSLVYEAPLRVIGFEAGMLYLQNKSCWNLLALSSTETLSAFEQTPGSTACGSNAPEPQSLPRDANKELLLPGKESITQLPQEKRAIKPCQLSLSFVINHQGCN